jgi:hypothetical protein
LRHKSLREETIFEPVVNGLNFSAREVTIPATLVGKALQPYQRFLRSFPQNNDLWFWKFLSNRNSCRLDHFRVGAENDSTDVSIWALPMKQFPIVNWELFFRQFLPIF